ncbi:uncharacterized protein [Nothobranchius furzeri]|nr:uncharacterized protein LOC107379098 isoform X2 [Nothobranchius furzeri]
MDSSQPAPLFLRSTSAVSLNERFSQTLMRQLTQSVTKTSYPTPPRRRRSLKLAWSAKRPGERWSFSNRVRRAAATRQKMKMCLRRRSIWSRLGWHQVTRRQLAYRPAGFWSFRNKYRWGSRITWRRQRHLSQMLQWGGVKAVKRRGFYRKDVPTKKQLDAQLDEYMSLSRSRLDKELADYMSMSRRHLDAQLDEYMLMAGQSCGD